MTQKPTLPKPTPASSNDAAPLSVATLTQLINALSSLGINILSPHDQMLAEQSTATRATPAPPAEQEVFNDEEGVACPSDSDGDAKGKAPAAPVPTGPPVGRVYPREEAPSPSSSSSVPAVGESSTSTAISQPHTRASITADGTITGFLCSSCQQYNLVQPARESFYAVVAGRAVGVFRGWTNVQPLVSGVPHANYKKYASEQAAIQAFEEAVNAGRVVVLP